MISNLEIPMASIVIRNLDDHLKEQLRIASALAGHSMEEHVRQLIEREVGAEVPSTGFGTWIHEQFRGIDATELEVPQRTAMAEPMSFPK